MEEKTVFLPTKPSKKKCILLIGLILGIYGLENSFRWIPMSSFRLNYIIKPILWIGLTCIVWKLPRIRAKGKSRFSKLIYFWAFNFAMIYILISILAGLINGLGKSPYDHSIRGIMINIVYVGATLFGREFFRSYLTNSFSKKENYLVFSIITLFMTIISMPIVRYTGIGSLQGLVRFLAEYFAPEFAKSFLATYLVYIGGPFASIIYLATMEAFHWFSPILPDLRWITTALIGILFPAFFLMFFKLIYLNASKEKTRYRDEDGSPLSWMITSIISIGIIWFAVGVFPIYPSVIATGSMEPMIRPGDIILVRKVLTKESFYNLKINDVIQFKRGNILISHRIIDILEDEDGPGFITKGDNNSSRDGEIVRSQEVRGIIVHNIPKLGWPTLLLKSNKDIPLDDILN